MKRSIKVYPMPGAVRRAPRGKQWVIEEPARDFLSVLLGRGASRPCTDISSARMIVPLDDSRESLRSRVHEMLHARFSLKRPPRISGASHDAVLAAEDARIAGLGAALDLYLGDPDTMTAQAIAQFKAIDSMAPSGTQAILARRSFGLQVASLGATAQGIAVLKGIAPLINAAKWCNAPGYFLSVKIAHAHAFARAAARRGPIGALRYLARGFETLFPLPPSNVPHPVISDAPHDSDCRYALDQSGAMEMDRAPLSERIAPRTVRPIVRHLDYGAVLRAPHRWAVDRAVFRTSRQRPRTGGAILLDGSGSMALRSGDVERLLRARPASTIAIYDSGSSGDGALRILAQNGRRVHERYAAPPNGEGGNGVDARAVEWLNKQPAPRWFITDGEFFGGVGHDTKRYRHGTRALMKRGDVKQIGSIEDFLSDVNTAK